MKRGYLTMCKCTGCSETARVSDCNSAEAKQFRCDWCLAGKCRHKEPGGMEWGPPPTLP